MRAIAPKLINLVFMLVLLLTLWRGATPLTAAPEIPDKPTSGALLQMTHNKNSRNPGWSPDGKQMTFTCGNLYIMNADGSNIRQLTEPFKVSHPILSPKGKQIAFQTNRRDL